MTVLPEVNGIQRVRSFLSKNLVSLVLAAFTCFYFLDVCLRASAKHFWYDELLTLYFARLPNLHSLWGALQTGVESNPPAFHLLTKATEAIFGEGLVATRLPEIVSFWILSLCLYRYVSQRSGVLAGFIALILPMETGVYYYAYEARPLIMVACLGAVALLSFDAANRHARRKWWLTAFSFSLFAALMLHCYAVLLLFPFALVEIIRTFRSRRIAWDFWIALLLPVLPALPLYFFLLRAFSVIARGTDFAFAFPAHWGQALKFYSFLLTPSSVTLLVALVLFSIDFPKVGKVDRELNHGASKFSEDDALLAAAFISLPALGVLLAGLVHSPFFGRYFLSAIIGIVVVIAIRTGVGPTRRRMTAILLSLLCFTLCLNFLRLMRHWHNGTGESMLEPSTLEPISTTRSEPLEWYPLLGSVSKDQTPIVLLNPTDFLYLVQYAPQLASRLYIWTPDNRDATTRGLAGFRSWSPVSYNAPLIGRQLTTAHPEFYVYGGHIKIENFGRLARIADVESLKTMEESYLVKMQAKTEQFVR